MSDETKICKSTDKNETKDKVTKKQSKKGIRNTKPEKSRIIDFIDPDGNPFRWGHDEWPYHEKMIVRNGKLVPYDGGPSDYPGYFDEEGHIILPEEMNDERPPTPDECKELKRPGWKLIRDGKVVPYDGKKSDYPGYFDEEGNFVQTEDDSGPEWY